MAEDDHGKSKSGKKEKLEKYTSLFASLIIVLAMLHDESLIFSDNIVLLIIVGLLPALFAILLSLKSRFGELLPIGVCYLLIGILLVYDHQQLHLHHFLLIMAALSLIIMPQIGKLSNIVKKETSL
ncbi:MAG: hypothetical protein R6U91_01755 [Bacillota bacterium]